MTSIWTAQNQIFDINDVNDNNKPPSIQSNRQFRYLFDNYNNDNHDKNDARLRMLLRLTSKCKTADTSISDWANILSDWSVYDNLSDYDIYNNIRIKVMGNSISSSLLSTNITDDINNDADRGNYLANIILDCVPTRLQTKGVIGKLLDYGCSEGYITNELGRQLCIPSNQVYGADVRMCTGSGYTFIKLSDEQDNEILPFDDGAVDVIVASMVLHHVKNQSFIISEFKRILSPNGIVIIREHDCIDSYFSVFLDIVHGLYSFVSSTTIKWPGFISEAKMHYLSKENWDKLFQQEGFKLISHESESSLKHYNYKSSTSFNQRYQHKPKISNMLRAYCAVYTHYT